MWNLCWDDCRTIIIQYFSCLKCKPVENILFEVHKEGKIIARILGFWQKIACAERLEGAVCFIRSAWLKKFYQEHLFYQSWINRVGTSFCRSGEFWDWKALGLMGELRLLQDVPCKSTSVGLNGSTDSSRSSELASRFMVFLAAARLSMWEYELSAADNVHKSDLT